MLTSALKNEQLPPANWHDLVYSGTNANTRAGQHTQTETEAQTQSRVEEPVSGKFTSVHLLLK